LLKALGAEPREGTEEKKQAELSLMVEAGRHKQRSREEICDNQSASGPFFMLDRVLQSKNGCALP
jgi:hypothetical protein